MASLTKPFRRFFKKKSRYKVIYGGRASSKSYNTALHSIILSRHLHIKVLALRQFQSNINQSVYVLLKSIIYENGWQDEFDILTHTIRHKKTGSEFIFMGILRDLLGIKGVEGVDVCWIEEAEALTLEQWKVIDPTIRKKDSEVWLVFNPNARSDFVWQRFVERPHPNTESISINYDENPHLSDTIRSVIDAMKEEDYEEYEHVYLGKPHETDEKALFSYADIEDSMNRNTKPEYGDIHTYGVDVARYGNDSSVISKRTGYNIHDMQSVKGYNTMELANLVISKYESDSLKPDAIFVDTIGVGAGVYDRLEERNYRAVEANVGMKPENATLYVNKRAEMYFMLRDWIRKGGCLPSDPDLKEELMAVTYEYSAINGKIQITAKDKIKELIGRSPDKADSVALHFFSTVVPAAVKGDLMSIQNTVMNKRLNNARRR